MFTDNPAHTKRAWDTLEVDGVIVGDVPSIRVDNMPCGSIRNSGLSREGVRWAMDAMSEIRLLVIRG